MKFTLFSAIVLSISLVSVGALTGFNITACNNNFFFDTITLNCKACPTNTVSNGDTSVHFQFRFECVCQSGYSSAQDQIGWLQGKGDRVLPCTACTDCACPDGQSKIQYNLDGSATTTLQCVTCAPNAYLNSLKECVPCPHPSMIYDINKKECVCGDNFVESQGTCVSQDDIDTMGGFGQTNNNYNVLNYNDYVASSGGQSQIKSATIALYYLKAAIGCQIYKDQRSCSQLANMCLLTMDMQSIPCKLYQSLVNGLQVTMPKLFYSKAGNVVLEETPMKMLVSFTEKPSPYVHQFEYYLIEYNMDGDVVGKLRIMEDELLICGNSKDDSRILTQFGRKYSDDCVIDLSVYVTDYKTRFFQLFLQDIDGTLIDIPILALDLLDPKGVKVNAGVNSGSYQFLYRFFMVDNLGPILQDQPLPVALRFAQDTSLNIYIDNSRADSIYLPYVTIDYRQIQVQVGGAAGSMNADAFFSVNYTYDPEAFWRVNNILFMVFLGVIGVIWLVRLWIWSKCNPPFVAEQTWTVYLCTRGFFILIDTFGEGMFYYLLMVTGYWFFFFKFQQSIYVLMPSFDDYPTNYRPYEATFYTMFACKLLSLVNMIYNQGDLEIFFVDWEKTEITRPKELISDIEKGFNDTVERYNSKVSCWRTVMIANEFNELQTFRIISVEWTQLFMALFLVGLNWQSIAVNQPGADLGVGGSRNYVLRYFLSTSVYLAIGLVQIIGRKIFDIWFPIAIEDFVDLCSVANVSIIIVDDTLHGYYIHGENPVGFSEGSSEHLAHCLHYESMGKGKHRGFVQGKNGIPSPDDDLQTFEIFLSARFRDSYDQVFTLELKKLTNVATNNARLDNMYRSKQKNPVPLDLDMPLVELQRQKMQFYLKDVLTQIRANPAQHIRSKIPVQRFLGFPPPELDNDVFKNQSLPIFYSIRDPDHSFKNIFFCGKEYYLLVGDICIFNFWLMITDNVFAALLLSYFVISGLFSYRQWLGERNLSMKSKIDQRFLI